MSLNIAPYITAVNLCPTHDFSKSPQACIKLLKGLGVEGDAHCGEKVKHRSRVAQNPDQPNLRQVHLMHAELHDALNTQGFDVSAGDMGENITTCGIDLLSLPVGTKLHLGTEAIIQLTGLRNPCRQINMFQDGLIKAVLDKTDDGKIIRKSGVMAIVLKGGLVSSGDKIQIDRPAQPHIAMEPI